MAVYIQEGKTINYLNTGDADIKYGEVVVLTDIVGVAASDIPAGTLGAVTLSGVFEVKATTAAAFTVGQKLYWDASAKEATNVSESMVPLGVAVAAKAQAESAVNVKIGG